MQGDADLIAANILKGKEIFGVAGTLLEGIPLTGAGLTKYAIKKVTFSQDQVLQDEKKISHTLGEIPKISIIHAENVKGQSGQTGYRLITGVWVTRNDGYSTFSHMHVGYSANSGEEISVGSEASSIKFDTGNIVLKTSMYIALVAGKTYTLITMA